MSDPANFSPPEGFVPDDFLSSGRVLSRRQKLRRKFCRQKQAYTAFIHLPRRVRRSMTVAMGWRIKSDPNGRGVFHSRDVLPGSKEWPDVENTGKVQWADLYLLANTPQPDRFFNVTLTTVSMTWAHAITEHVEAIIEGKLTAGERKRGRARPYVRPLPGGGSEMIFAPHCGLDSLDGLTISGAQAKWLREHWPELATLVRPVGESARLAKDYAFGVGLSLVTAEPTLSVDSIARAVAVFRERGEQDYEAPPEDFETHRASIEAMLKGSLWHWDASEARSRGEGRPADPSEDVLLLMGHESNAIRM